MNKVLKKIELPNRPPRNPTPSLNDGGDCGACVLAGVLNISVEEAYHLHESGKYYGGGDIPKTSCFDFYSMKRTLKSLTDDLELRKENGFPPAPLEHVVTNIPTWLIDQFHDMSGLAFGISGGMQYFGWVNYVRAMLSAGYYGICQVYNGGHKDLKEHGLTNHWVMLAGWQYVYVENTNKEIKHLNGCYTEEVLICNSALNEPLEKWIGAGDFLKFWGGFGVLWAKPKI